MPKLFSLSEASSIAVHAMVLVAKADGSVNVNKISELTQTSKHHVAKVMQRLTKAGYVSSSRGPNGGFSLKVTPESISFLNIYEAIEGKAEIAACLFESPVCAFHKCIMNNITVKLSNEFISYLKSQTLDRFI